ncbi:glycosyltransferase [Maribacter sp. M208]|uniref:glycosyltransferase n=1 Tax=Maribacter huludaoensis TaxID=3030010 RepID=UPI0023EBB8F7|nr:glycosyltransferase [Maribacter huludaoensis]MDF4221116.1 glycosyltransferase [Maribacter huludaoensis]
MTERSLSVIMSVYYKEKPAYLELALDSIWTLQTLKPTQIILIEDGELTDELNVIIEKWKQVLQDILLIHKNKTNVGLTKSLNIGINHATGQYIARMDSDDVSVSGRFIKQVEYLEKHKDYSVVGSLAQEIDEDGNYTNIRTYPITDEEVRNYICKACPLQHAGVMFKREIFDNGIRYNEDYRLTQDLALWFTILSMGYKIGNIPECLIQFRITQDSFISRDKSKGLHEFKIYMKGILQLKGVTWRYVYPLSRIIMRYMPPRLIKIIYNSPLRKLILK